MYHWYLLLSPHVFRMFAYDTIENEIFRDDFDGNSLDYFKWTPTHRTSSVNLELQSYTPQNVGVRSGFLEIVSKVDRDEKDIDTYTSGRVDTGQTFNFLYGEIEWRAKYPKGKGLWTALWLSHYKCSAARICAHWPPAIGMIDARGDKPFTIIPSLFYSVRSPSNVSRPFSIPDRMFTTEYVTTVDITDGFHLYKLLWTNDTLVWYFDNKEFCSISDPAKIPSERMQIVMSVAVGGTFGGPPDSSTIFPTKMLVDWVVVRQSATAPQNGTAPSGSNSAKPALAAILGSVLPVTAGMVVCLGLCYWRRRRWIRGDMRKEPATTLTASVSSYSNRIHLPVEDDPASVTDMNYVKLLGIPLDDLEISDLVLGSGEYGIVRKGLVRGLCGQPRPTVVAIKSVQNDKDMDQIRQLGEEMKMMVKAGRHLNIVNLLGAVVKGDMLLLLEFCTFGSLLKYIRLHRGACFYDHVDSAGQLLEWNSDEQKRLQDNIAERPATHTFAHDGFDITVLSTRDLISFAFQISRGMEYLNSRSIIHRDLAARNVLVTEGRITKICDFGMARQQAEYIVYNQQVPLPIRWMPPESIKGRVFSQLSDVWSFGVLLWEIFTLGDTPYGDSGMSGYIAQFLNTLSNGYQMDRPPYCPNVIYDVMRKCWELTPTDRPVFSNLHKSLQDILGRDSVETYLSLDIPYQQFNSAYQKVLSQ